jgi:hypothetical protein
MKLFYISFASETEFLGATVLEAVDEIAVLNEATRQGLNPGGQAAILELPYRALAEADDIRSMQGRLIGKEEMKAMGGKRHGDLDDDMQNKFENASFRVDQ